jgi:hypothetical protein
MSILIEDKKRIRRDTIVVKENGRVINFMLDRYPMCNLPIGNIATFTRYARSFTNPFNLIKS